MSTETARKWQALAERRRRHFAELHGSGRSRRIYSEETLQAGMRDAERDLESWGKIIEQSEATNSRKQNAQLVAAEEPDHRRLKEPVPPHEHGAFVTRVVIILRLDPPSFGRGSNLLLLADLRFETLFRSSLAALRLPLLSLELALQPLGQGFTLPPLRLGQGNRPLGSESLRRLRLRWCRRGRCRLRLKLCHGLGLNWRLGGL